MGISARSFRSGIQCAHARTHHRVTLSMRRRRLDLGPRAGEQDLDNNVINKCKLCIAETG